MAVNGRSVFPLQMLSLLSTSNLTIILAMVYDLDICENQTLGYLQFGFACSFLYMSLNHSQRFFFFLNKFIGKINWFP